MILFVALLAVAPLSALIVGGSKVRLGLVVTTLVTGASVTLLSLCFEYPDDVATIIIFYYVVLPLVCGIVAGLLATRFVGSRRALGLPIVGGIIGALAGLALGTFARPFVDLEDVFWTVWFVTPPVVVGSSFAVLAAALGMRRI